MTTIPAYAAPTWLDDNAICIQLDGRTVKVPLTQLHQLPTLLRGLATDAGAMRDPPRNLARERQLAQIEDHIRRQEPDLHALGLL